MLRIEEELKKNQISRFHLIYGEERYMVRYYRNMLIQQLTEPGDAMNCTIFRNRTVDPIHVAEAGEVLPFFADRRLLVVEDSFFFNNTCDMLDYLKYFPETTYVVFVERKVDRRNRLYKWVNKNGCVTECVHQSERMLKQWVLTYAKKAGKAISVSAAELLMERVGSNMELLGNEMEKCIGYVGKRKTIDETDVDIISTGVVVSRIFDMIDAVALKEKEKALSLYTDLIANKESPMSILYLFSRHINILLQIKECVSRGFSKAEIAKKCDIPPFTVDKYSRQAATFKKKQLNAMLESRLEYEEQFKSGKLSSDQLAVEMFLLQILAQ